MLISLGQLASIFIAILVAIFGYRVHERMRLQHYFGELRIWSSSCLDVLSEAVHLCDLDPKVTDHPDFFNRRHALLVRVSSLIDQGKLFFPNVEIDESVDWQQERHQNRKHRPLDDLIYAYGALKKMSYEEKTENDFLRPHIVEIKRDFAAAMQNFLNPQKAHKQFGLAMKHKTQKK